jgi:hypothetical protein
MLHIMLVTDRVMVKNTYSFRQRYDFTTHQASLKVDVAVGQPADVQNRSERERQMIRNANTTPQVQQLVTRADQFKELITNEE